jgi:hypothetical protein
LCWLYLGNPKWWCGDVVSERAFAGRFFFFFFWCAFVCVVNGRYSKHSLCCALPHSSSETLKYKYTTVILLGILLLDMVHHSVTPLIFQLFLTGVGEEDLWSFSPSPLPFSLTKRCTVTKCECNSVVPIH